MMLHAHIPSVGKMKKEKNGRNWHQLAKENRADYSYHLGGDNNVRRNCGELFLEKQYDSMIVHHKVTPALWSRVKCLRKQHTS